LKAFIHQSELELISRFVMDYPDSETGGDFFGAWTKNGEPIVQFITGPGKGTTRTSTSFYQDIDYLKKCGSILNRKYGLEHIGAWHSHHKLSLYNPSSGDINTMKNALKSQNLPRFLISICNINSNSQVSVSGFLFVKDSDREYIDCKWEVLEGTSPIRASINSSNSDLFTSPKTNRAVSNIQAYETGESIKGQKIEKPDLPADSFWTTTEGRTYLKKAYEKMQNRNDISEVELLQLEDKRIAISFNYHGEIYELIFPKTFPADAPEIIQKEVAHSESLMKQLFKSNKRADKNILELVNSLHLVDKDKIIIIRHLQ